MKNPSLELAKEGKFDQIRSHPAVWLIEIFAAMSAVVGVWLTYGEISRARSEALELRTIQSWEAISNLVPGNTGKVSALKHLADGGISLEGIDLSCSPYDQALPTPCNGRVYLYGIDLSSSSVGRRVMLRRANLGGVYAVDSDFSNAYLYQADFQLSELMDAVFDGAFLRGSNFRGADLTGSNFVNADLSDAIFEGAVLLNANFESAQVSRAKFTGAHGISSATFSGVWAWEDLPPVGLDTYISCPYDEFINERPVRPKDC